MDVSCRRLKFRELFWRPVTAIIVGYGTNTTVDPQWTPLLSTPQHPEYALLPRPEVSPILSPIL